MNAIKEYEVLRLIECNQMCYVSTDIRKGWTLTEWVKTHPYISKKLFFQWLSEMIGQINLFHKCRGNPSYQYVNPFCMIITEDEKLCFLDVHAKSNEEIIDMMRRRDIREFFQQNDAGCTGEKADFYGLGKTLQYLVNFFEIKPELTKAEERKLRKIIAEYLQK